MTQKGFLKNSLRRSRVIRYKAYKKVGLARHRRQIDLSLFLMLILCIGSFPFLIRPSDEGIESVLPVEEIEEMSVEEVHEDLGDEPVVAPQKMTLTDLEKQVQLGDLTMETKTLEPKSTLLGLLSQSGVASSDRVSVVNALEMVVNVKSLKPGTTFMLFWNKDKKLVGISAQTKGNETVGAIHDEDEWTPFTEAGRVETHTERVMGQIERTFSGSAKKSGVPDTIIAQITAALDGEVDFYTDSHAGDTFDVIYETKTTPGGLEIGTKQLLFIGLKLGKKGIYRYAYTNKAGLTSFYDAKGKSGEKALMKRPVMGRARLSSPYGQRRHPILKYVIFHHGVDLAIATGTPIQAGADGVITMLGRKGGYGKYIRIRHADSYQTAYGHMNAYRQDLKVGSKVKRGEVIGYVGSTGRSTGPHLHYEVIKNNKTVNPFGKNVISSKQLSGFELEQFQSAAEGLHPDFERHRIGKIPPVPTLPPF